MKRIYIKWFDEQQQWTESTRSEFAHYLNESNDIDITDDESYADLIIVHNKHLLPRRRFEVKLLASAYFRENARRLLIYDETDNPSYVLPGLYVSTDLRRCGSHVVPVPYLHKKLQSDFHGKGLKKSIVGSFWGRNSHPVRSKLYDLNDQRYSMIDTTTFDFFDLTESNQASLAKQRSNYINSLESSMYSICPRGYGSCSIRLFESVLSHTVPVILSDHYVPPPIFDWNIASVRIPESDAANVRALIDCDYKNYADRIDYIKEVAAPSLLPGSVSSYICSALPQINVIGTYKRFLVSLMRRIVR